MEFLATLNISQRNRKDYEGLLFLFVDYLCHDSSSVIESEDGEFLLKYGWDVYYGGAISNFIDHWMPRKVIGADELQQKAPGILRKWLKWCHEEGYFDKDRLDEFLRVKVLFYAELHKKRDPNSGHEGTLGVTT